MKKLILLFAFVLSMQSISSQKFTFEIAPFVGVSFAKIDELVYSNNIKESQIEGKNYKPFVGINTVFLMQNFMCDFTVQSCIPVALGIVTDKDFFISEQNPIAMFSEHNLITDKDYLFELNLSYKFNLPVLNFGLGVSGIYSNTKMEAVDGYLQYPENHKEWTGNESKDFLNGTVISYEQSRFLAGMTIFMEKEFSCLSFLLKGSFYPFVSVECIDNHFLRSVQFLDSMKEGFAYSVKFNADWKINKTNSLFLNTSFSYLAAEGNSFVNPLGIITSETKEVDKTCTVATNYCDLSFVFGFLIQI